MTTTLLILAAALAGAGLWLASRLRQRSQRRQQALSQLLDAADALETRLRAARSEIEAIAGDHENPVRLAMQDLLRQRLWLQEHAQTASLDQLGQVRTALDAACTRIDQQLRRVDRARAGSA